MKWKTNPLIDLSFLFEFSIGKILKKNKSFIQSKKEEEEAEAQQQPDTADESFQVGERVIMRDFNFAFWKEGLISQISPLEVALTNQTCGFKWNEVKKVDNLV